AGTRPCQAADLQAVFGGIGALTGGQLGASILFGNRSGRACILQGVPAVQLFDSGGHQIPLTTRPAEGLPPAEPVLVQPGTADVQAYIPRAGIAYVGIDWQTHDGAGVACVPTPREATAIAVSFPAGGSSPRGVAKEPHILNCRPAGTIAAGRSVRFAMQIPVPKGTQPGPYDLRWQFVGMADLTLRQGKATVTVKG